MQDGRVDRRAELDRTWVVVVPVKRLERAKTRLSARTAGQRRDLALAFALDTVHTALGSPGVEAVVVVTDDPLVRSAVETLGAGCISDEPDDGLNAALEHGAAHVGREHPGTGIAVLSADLPALRPDELGRALAAASSVPRGFVADSAGTGTTLLTSGPGIALDPRFGPRSRAAHAASGAIELSPVSVPGLRRDVDTEVDLWDAGRLGLGVWTSTALGIDAALEP
jgi:2-phospho-L-lactate guanylyltransferase